MRTNGGWRVLSLLISIVAVLIAFGGAFSPLPALAASEPTGFKDVVLSVYPEYDDPLGLGTPTVLVMLEGLIEGASPPATVRFLVPKDAIMYSAGSGPRQNYVGGPPRRNPSGIDGWDEISYELKTNYFVVEYYAPIQTSPNKAFSAELIPLYPINGLVAFVQEPRQATEFRVTAQSQPASQQPFTDDQGFKTQRYNYGAVKSRQSVAFSISYVKSSSTPSLGIAKPPSNTGLIVAAAIAGGLLVGLGLYRALRKSSPGKRGRGKISSKPGTGKSSSARFCSKCGTRMEASQRFCPQCGAKQREQ